MKLKKDEITGYLKRDNHWLSLAIAAQSLGLVLFFIALIVYWAAGIGGFALSITLLVFSMLCIIPGVFATLYIRKQKKIKEGSYAPKYNNSDVQYQYDAPAIEPPPPAIDQEYTPPQDQPQQYS